MESSENWHWPSGLYGQIVVRRLKLEDPLTGQRVKFWDGRTTMRTLADALEKLLRLRGLAPNGKAVIRAMPVPLPDGGTFTTIAVLPALRNFRWGVVMRSAGYFDATGTDETRLPYAISRLDGAITDVEGNVELAEGVWVYNVELRREKLHYELTPIEKEILGHALSFLGVRVLDYHAIAELGNERLSRSLKEIEGYVKQHVPASRQTIAHALAVAGLRRPRSGPRQQRKSFQITGLSHNLADR